MKVSIIIPCYNEKNTIERAIEALRSAPVKDKELIVVDDGSEDGKQSASILNPMARELASA
jgi:glycosyltransferase involved in cell wall biosynthesis